MNIPHLSTSYKPIDDMLYEGYGPVVLNGALELGFFDSLEEGPQNAKGIAQKIGAVENLTEALAEALAAMWLLEKNGEDYSLTPTTREYLVRSSGAYQGGSVRNNLAFGAYMARIPELMKTGAPAPDKNVYSSMAGGINISGELSGDWIAVDPEWLITENSDIIVREALPQSIHQEFLTKFFRIDYDLSKQGVFTYPKENE